MKEFFYSALDTFGSFIIWGLRCVFNMIRSAHLCVKWLRRRIDLVPGLIRQLLSTMYVETDIGSKSNWQSLQSSNYRWKAVWKCMSLLATSCEMLVIIVDQRQGFPCLSGYWIELVLIWSIPTSPILSSATKSRTSNPSKPTLRRGTCSFSIRVTANPHKSIHTVRVSVCLC